MIAWEYLCPSVGRFLFEKRRFWTWIQREKEQEKTTKMQPSGLLRNMRNVVHNYTEVEIKVREATSNDPWGPR